MKVALTLRSQPITKLRARIQYRRSTLTYWPSRELRVFVCSLDWQHMNSRGTRTKAPRTEAPWTKAPWTKAPWTKAPGTKDPGRQKFKVFSTLFLGKNKLKQRNYIRTMLRLEELNKRENLIQKR